MNVSVEELRSNPKLIEPKMEDMLFIMHQIIPIFKLQREQGIEKFKVFLKDKFFPQKIRYKIWICVIPDPCKLNELFFRGYLEAVINNFTNIPNKNEIDRQ